MAAATLLATDPPGWAPGTNLYRIGDSDHLAVEASTAAMTLPVAADPVIGDLLTALDTDLMSTRMLVRPTVVFHATDEGLADSLTPLATYPPGTSHADALTALGHTLTEDAE